ncbi:DUF2306 domain-containing protein [Flagellimonas sp.]|uniref:DUF2306 domain-containing protein n=1 Tax=Flagellimonas sp. TaxID=2058762 RepID=UPI003B500A2B
MNIFSRLEHTTIFWFTVTLTGQWIFAAYVAIYHGYKILENGMESMGGKHMPNGYIVGDSAGNALLASHLIIPIFVILAGPLQLVPKIQKDYRGFHKWIGRVYLPTIFILSLGGIYLTWSRPRPSFGSIFQDIAITVEGILIILFAIQTLRFAFQKKIEQHRKWAVRLFIVASGVWFLRIGYRTWFFIEDLLGFQVDNFFDYWSFASYLIPLAILELYLKVKKSKSNKSKRVYPYCYSF